MIDRSQDLSPPEGRTTWIVRWQPTLAWAAAIGILFVFVLTQMSARREFVYFQF
jgi:hypothetical protein